jgi:hypothetical protein
VERYSDQDWLNGLLNRVRVMLGLPAATPFNVVSAAARCLAGRWGGGEGGGSPPPEALEAAGTLQGWAWQSGMPSLAGRF